MRLLIAAFALVIGLASVSDRYDRPTLLPTVNENPTSIRAWRLSLTTESIAEGVWA